jgi:hypothetical protein
MSFIRYSCCALLAASTILIEAKTPKIVGLVPVRNEEILIANCLRALVPYTDAIVVLDDVSTDKTLAIVESLKEECHVERIIAKKEWIRDEKADREAMLVAGREIGGTHFIVVDADEIFAAPCANDNWLRNTILQLRPGQILIFPYLHVWGDHLHYRNDELCSPGKPFIFDPIFCDDGSCSYYASQAWGPSGTIHVGRIPANLNHKQQVFVPYDDIQHGLIHLRFVNLDQARVKVIWYMCLELIRKGETERGAFARQEHAIAINNFYRQSIRHAPLFYEAPVKLEEIPESWYDYPGFDTSCFNQTSALHRLQKAEVLGWMQQYGVDYFKELNIWHVNWLNLLRK